MNHRTLQAAQAPPESPRKDALRRVSPLRRGLWRPHPLLPTPGPRPKHTRLRFSEPRNRLFHATTPPFAESDTRE